MRSSSNDSSLSNKSLKQQDQSETPIGVRENKILFKSLNTSETTPQHFQSLIAEKTSIFINSRTEEEDKLKRQNFDSLLSSGLIEKSKIQNSINQSMFKELSPSTSNNDSQMTIEFENDNYRQSSIIEFSQMENLLHGDRNFLQTPSYNEEITLGYNNTNYCQSESLLSFERHEKSNAEMTATSSSKKSSHLHDEETFEFENEYSMKHEPVQSSKSPTCNKVKAKVELFQNKPKPFSKSHQIFPKTSELSPCLQKTLKSSLENSISKIEDSSVTQVTPLNNFDKIVSSVFLKHLFRAKE
jgi:hypothetical protein